MNAIGKAISEVYYRIPREIIRIAFSDNPRYANTSMDEELLSRVIRPRVLVDCNLVGGVLTYILINRCSVKSFYGSSQYEYIIDVPKILTGGRSIITPINVLSVFNNGGSGNNNNDSPLIANLNQMMNNVTNEMPVISTRLEMKGENKILLITSTALTPTGTLKCMVENSETLSNIDPRSYLTFANLTVLCVKSYIYNTLVVKLGNGYIQNGHDLGIVTDMIDKYTTSDDEYHDYLKSVWSVVAYHNDRTRLRNFITRLI